MKRKAIIPLVLGLAIGLLAVKFGVDAIRQAQASNAAKTTISVVRAKLDIAAHEEIRSEMLELIETEESVLIPANDRIEALEKATGRVTSKAIPKDSPVFLSMLAPEGTKPGIIGRIPSGYRAVSVKIDEVTGVAYQLTPGAWVDITVVMDIDTGSRGRLSHQKETVAEVILQRVQVAAVGYGGTPEADTGVAKVKPAKSATLLVKEDDVPKLHLAQTKGKITLSMRGDEDTGVDKPALAFGREIGGSDQLSDLPPGQSSGLDFAAPVMDEPEPAPPHNVLVFHRSTTVAEDSTVEQIVFENGQSTNIVGISMGAPSRAAATMRALSENERSGGRSNATRERTSGADSRKPDSGDGVRNLPSNTGE